MKIQSIFKKNWDYYILGFLVILYTGIFSYYSLLRHNAFASGYDLSNMDQTIWNTLQGRFFTLSQSGQTISRFAIHGDIILALLSPLYLIWPNVRILLIFQSLAIGIGAIPVYLLAKKVVKNKIVSLIVVLLYLLNPALQWSNIYDFHAVALAMPLLLFAFYFAYTKNWRWFIVTAMLAAMTKEEVPITVAILGIFIFFMHKKYRFIGVITFIAGLLTSYIVIKVVIPHYNIEHDYMYASWYKNFSDEFKNDQYLVIPQNIINKYLISPTAFDYYNLLFRPFLYLPLFGWPFLLFSMPELLANLFSDHAQVRSIVFHYDSVIIPGLVISTIFALSYLQKIAQKLSAHFTYAIKLFYVIPLAALIVALRFDYHYNPLPIAPSCWCVTYEVHADDVQFDKLLASIPTSASVTASPEVRSHITHRENAYTLPEKVKVVDYIALIDQNRILGDYSPKTYELELVRQFAKDKSYKLVQHIGHFYLYKRNNAKDLNI